MSFSTTQLVGFGGRRRIAIPTKTYVTSAANSTAGTSTTFSVSLGTASPQKRIVVGFTVYSPSGSPTLNSATVDGNSAAIACQTVISAGALTGFICANVGDSATSGDVVLTWSTSMQYSAIAVWKVADLTTNTASAFNTDTGTPASLTLNVPANHLCFAFCGTIDGSPTAPSSWVGLTSDGTQAVGSAIIGAFASDFFATAQTPLTVSVTVPGGRTSLAAASFGN